MPDLTATRFTNGETVECTTTGLGQPLPPSRGERPAGTRLATATADTAGKVTFAGRENEIAYYLYGRPALRARPAQRTRRSPITPTG